MGSLEQKNSMVHNCNKIDDLSFQKSQSQVNVKQQKIIGRASKNIGWATLYYSY